MTDYIRMDNLSKSFGDVKANNQICFGLKKGEIHALLGENGAGKSTLMNMLSGIYQPDSGLIQIAGQPVSLTSPKEAIANGIGMIHQHYKLVDNMTATENILIGQKGSFFLNKKKSQNKIKALCQNYGINLPMDRRVSDMSVGEKQSVEIMKVLYQGAKVLIMDEPTAVLTPQETERLFVIMRDMVKKGCAIIIITHKLHEVMAVSDRITVLRKGRSVKTLETEKTNAKQLTELMVGKKLDLSIKRPVVERGNCLLKVNRLSAWNKEKVQVLQEISFELYEGEILGVAGVAGNGQKELCEAIAGLYKDIEGEIYFKDQVLSGKTPGEIIRQGITMSFVPEDRLGMGLVPAMDMVDNYLLKEHHQQASFWLQKEPIRKQCETMINRLSIDTPGVFHPISQLSGGNIQKVLLGREIEMNPHVLITAYPVRGLDIGASMTIYDLINEQKQKGVAILFIGEDLDVLMSLCDRIMVLSEGQLTGLVKTNQITKEELGLMMAGEVLAS